MLQKGYEIPQWLLNVAKWLENGYKTVNGLQAAYQMVVTVPSLQRLAAVVA